MYVYKNNTVEEEFKNDIHDNYFVEVKEIDRQNFDEEELSPVADENKETTDLSHVEDVKREQKVQELNVPIKVITNDTTNSKDIPDFETLKKTKPVEVQDETRLIDDQLDSSKFDAVVEDRQYVEVPVIRKEILKQAVLEDTKPVPKEDSTVEVKANDKKSTEKVNSKTQTVKETENFEIMHAEARSLGQRQVCTFFVY